MPVLYEVWRYPLKSAAGIRELEPVRLGPYGLEADHCYMVAYCTDGKFCSQRTMPKMSLIGTSISERERELMIFIPGQNIISVPLDDADGPRVMVSVHEDRNIIAIHQGSKAGQALSDYLGEAVMLVRIAPESKRRSPSGHPIAFHDAWPVHGVSRSSLDALNIWLKSPVDMRRFRPQLIFSDCSGFAEDRWAQCWIGNSTLLVGKAHCRRCEIPDVDPDRGQRKKGVFKALSHHRGKWDYVTDERRAYFGRNFNLKGEWLVPGSRIVISALDDGISFDPPGFKPARNTTA